MLEIEASEYLRHKGCRRSSGRGCYRRTEPFKGQVANNCRNRLSPLSTLRLLFLLAVLLRIRPPGVELPLPGCTPPLRYFTFEHVACAACLGTEHVDESTAADGRDLPARELPTGAHLSECSAPTGTSFHHTHPSITPYPFGLGIAQTSAMAQIRGTAGYHLGNQNTFGGGMGMGGPLRSDATNDPSPLDTIREQTSKIEDWLDTISDPVKPYLPHIGRFLIVVTFLEDALRIITQWSDQLVYLHDYRHSMYTLQHQGGPALRQCRRSEC